MKEKGLVLPGKAGRGLRDTTLALPTLLLILSFMATACGGAADKANVPPQAVGPALVMF